ncbi:hypothetical protein Btru_069018 [Bulinus truncatus]|nr:hypothetical protein Btru_069018 [Bulinus truncatus]
MFAYDHPKLRFLYVAWAYLESFGFGGLTYGWGSLVYVLKDEGIYQDLCDSVSVSNHSYRTGADCYERSSQFDLVFTLSSSFIGIGCFVCGQISFKFGTRVARVIASATFIAGAVMIAFTANTLTWVIFPGSSLMAFGGISIVLTNTQLAHLFPDGEGFVVGVLDGAYESSAVVPLLIKIGYEHGISRRTSFLILACAHLMTLVSTFMFLPKDHVRPERELYGGNQRVQTDDITKNKSVSVEGLMKHIVTATFLLHVFWFSIVQLRLYCIMGTINHLLEKLLSSQEEVSHFTDVVFYFLLGAVITSPVAGAFFELNIRYFKNHKDSFVRSMKPNILPLVVTSTLCLVLSTFVLLLDLPVYLYPTFAVLLLFRSFFYTTSIEYLVHVLFRAMLAIYYDHGVSLFRAMLAIYYDHGVSLFRAMLAIYYDHGVSLFRDMLAIYYDHGVSLFRAMLAIYYDHGVFLFRAMLAIYYDHGVCLFRAMLAIYYDHGVSLFRAMLATYSDHGGD